MPKAKLKFKKADQKKLPVAANFSGVKLGSAIVVGDDILVEASAPGVQSFLDMDRLIPFVTGNELDKPAAPAPEKTKK